MLHPAAAPTLGPEVTPKILNLPFSSWAMLITSSIVAPCFRRGPESTSARKSAVPSSSNMKDELILMIRAPFLRGVRDLGRTAPLARAGAKTTALRACPGRLTEASSSVKIAAAGATPSMIHHLSFLLHLNLSIGLFSGLSGISRGPPLPPPPLRPQPPRPSRHFWRKARAASSPLVRRLVPSGLTQARLPTCRGMVQRGGEAGM